MDNWDDFRFVLAVMEEGSLNAAARHLGVNHATVLRRINAFEDRSGIRIFERRQQGYQTVPALADAREALLQMADAAAQAQRAMLGPGAGLAGPLRITSTDSLCERVLPEAVKGLQDAHPALRLEVIVSNAYLDLSRLDAEVSVRPARSLPDTLRGDPVAGMRFGLYAAPEYLERVGPGATHRWLNGSGDLRRAPSVAWVDENIAPTQIALRADSFLTLRRSAQLGQGLALLPTFIVSPSHGLTLLEGIAPEITTTIWVAYHRDLEGLSRIEVCREHLAQGLAATLGPPPS